MEEKLRITAIGKAMFLILSSSCLFAGCGGNADWTADRIEQSERRGDDVVRALESYHSKNGKYPNALVQLQPEFIRVIAPPLAGRQKWDYVGSDRGYMLSFRRTDDASSEEFHVTHRSSTWTLVDKDF